MKRMLAALVVAAGGAYAVYAAQSPMTGGQSGSADSTQPGLAAWLKAVNESEIAQGNAARQKAVSRDVRRYGATMAREHELANHELEAALKQAGIQPADDEVTLALKQESQQESEMLQSAAGKDFDQSYLEREVETHRKVLDRIERALQGQKGDDAFAELLQRTREKVQRHLDEGERLQAKLRK